MGYDPRPAPGVLCDIEQVKHTHTLTGIAYLRHMLTPRHITEVGGASNEVFDLLYVI